MDKKRLEYYKKRLLTRRDELVKTITRTEEEGRQATCQEEMQQKRLEAVPWAKHCISCQEKMEQGLL